MHPVYRFTSPDPVNNKMFCYLENYASRVLEMLCEIKDMQMSMWALDILSKMEPRKVIEESCVSIIRRGRQMGNSISVFKAINYLPGDTILLCMDNREWLNVDIPLHVRLITMADKEDFESALRGINMGVTLPKDFVVENIIVDDVFALESATREKYYGRVIDFATTVFERQGRRFPFIVSFLG